jgi:hypothetical protein
MEITIKVPEGWHERVVTDQSKLTADVHFEREGEYDLPRGCQKTYYRVGDEFITFTYAPNQRLVGSV